MTLEDSPFDAGQLLVRLKRLAPVARYVVGFSGGADSTALLVAMHELGDRRAAPLQALHFHHGLHPDADAWLSHCTQFCAERGIDFRSERLHIVASGASPEAAAREARYGAVCRMLETGEVFLTAHHADDRAETLFLNLKRGSGIDGLASIPASRALGAGRVFRPLLDFARADLEHYLAARDIAWIEDPANRDTTMDRNYLRHELFPQLEKRWPGIVKRLAATAARVRETVDVLDDSLESRFGPLLADPWTLPAGSVAEQPRPLQALLIRRWVRDRIPHPPPANRLAEFLDQLESTDEDAAPVELRWAGWQIKRHRHRLWLHPCTFPAGCPSMPWPAGTQLRLDHDFGSLHLEEAKSVPEGLHVGPRRQGTAMRLHAGGPHRPVKDLLRESGIPPWLRDAVPVLYRDGDPQAVGDWHLSAACQEWLATHGAVYHWQPAHDLLRKLRAEAHAAIIDRPATLR